MRDLYESILSFADPARVLRDEPMNRHTTFRIGGPADVLFFPRDEAETAQALAVCPDALIIGKGSNLLVSDRGIRGLVIAFDRPMSLLQIEGDRITAQAGAGLPALTVAAQEAGLSGLEFASGIPGSVGGGVAMNAGAYGGELSDVLLSASLIEGGQVVRYPREEMAFGYRTSLPLSRGMVVLSARFSLTRDDPEAILARMREYSARRRDKQPVSMPSAGSVFKRPEGHFAGALIEQANLKGVSVGGAMVSQKHAGFIVNTGCATSCDVKSLIALIRRTVSDRFGVMLTPEIRFVGEEEE